MTAAGKCGRIPLTNMENHMRDTIGTYLRAKRTAAGKSLRDVAAAIGVSHVHLGEVERGRAPLARHHWEAVAIAIPGVTMEDLAIADANTRPVKINVSKQPGAQEVAVQLARRIESGTLDADDIHEILKILKGKTGQ